jgi:hypothetical protein
MVRLNPVRLLMTAASQFRSSFAGVGLGKIVGDDENRPVVILAIDTPAAAHPSIVAGGRRIVRTSTMGSTVWFSAGSTATGTVTLNKASCIND